MFPFAPLVPLLPLLPALPAEPLLPPLPLLPLLPPLPDVPLLPEVPAVPLLPLVPAAPDAPDDPEEPELPVVPAVPLLPLVPAAPLAPEEPLLPEEPLVPDVDVVVERYNVPSVATNTFATLAFVPEYTVGSTTVPDTPSEPVIFALPLTSRTKLPVGTLLIPTPLPDTTRTFAPYLPATTLSSLNTSNIGSPDASLTLINEPTRLFEMSKSEPEFFPMNETVPSGNTSRLMLADPTLLLKNIFGLLLPEVIK